MVDLRKPKRKRRPRTHPEKEDKWRAGKPRYNRQGPFTTFDGDKRERDDVFKGSKENIPAHNSTLSENIVKKKKTPQNKSIFKCLKTQRLFIHSHNEGMWEEVLRGVGKHPVGNYKEQRVGGGGAHLLPPNLGLWAAGQPWLHSDLKTLK